MQNTQDVHQVKFQFIYRMPFHKEIRNLKQLGILKPVKEVTEWVNSFVIIEKKVPIDSSNSHSLGTVFPWNFELALILET